MPWDVGDELFAWDCPPMQPAESLDFTLDLTILIGTDPITQVAWSVQPSGSGELQVSQVSVVGPIITGWLSNPIPGRVYKNKILVNLSSGRVYEFVVELRGSRTLAAYPWFPPPSYDFGPPVIYIPSFFTADGGFLTLSSTAGWPLSDEGLSVGALWTDGFVRVVVPTTPDPLAPPVFFGLVTSFGLLALGGANLPISDPGTLNQLWLNGGFVCISGL